LESAVLSQTAKSLFVWHCGCSATCSQPSGLQYVICRQKPGALNAMTAGILLKDLAKIGSLAPEPASALISIVQREKDIGQSLGKVLNEAAPALEKLVRAAAATSMLIISQGLLGFRWWLHGMIQTVRCDVMSAWTCWPKAGPHFTHYT
jgi:hypothetical protein